VSLARIADSSTVMIGRAGIPTPRRLRIQHDQQDTRIFTFLAGLAMLNEHIAGRPDQVVGMMRDIGHDAAGLA